KVPSYILRRKVGRLVRFLKSSHPFNQVNRSFHSAIVEISTVDQMDVLRPPLKGPRRQQPRKARAKYYRSTQFYIFAQQCIVPVDRLGSVKKGDARRLVEPGVLLLPARAQIEW